MSTCNAKIDNSNTFKDLEADKGPAVFIKDSQAQIQGNFENIKQNYEFETRESLKDNILNQIVNPGLNLSDVNGTLSENTPMLYLFWYECTNGQIKELSMKEQNECNASERPTCSLDQSYKNETGEVSKLNLDAEELKNTTWNKKPAIKLPIREKVMKF